MNLISLPYKLGYKFGQWLAQHPLTILWAVYIFWLGLLTFWVLITLIGAMVLLDFSILLPVFPFALGVLVIGYVFALVQLVRKLNGEGDER